MAESPEFLAQSTEELAAARGETKAKFQGILADTEERKFYKVILLNLQKQMQVSQNVVRTLHLDPTFKPDKDSVVEQLMGQIRNMEDTVSSVLVALEHGPNMGTSYRLNQVKGKSQDSYDTSVKLRANLEGVDDPGFAKIISSLTMQDMKHVRQCSRQLKERVELHCKNILILTARNKEDILAMKNLHLMPKKLNMENTQNLTNTGLLQLLAECSATLEDLNLNWTGFSGEGLESLPVLKQLEKVSLLNCKNLTNTGLLQLLVKCSATLEDLDLLGTEISGEGLESLPILKLQKLNLGGCKNMTNTGLLQLLAKCSATLKELSLTGTEISGEGLKSLLVLKQLETVNLGLCDNLTNTGLLQLLAKCATTLKDLDLYGTVISGEGLESLPLLKLEKLNLGHCKNLTNTGLLQLLAKCSATLEDLNLGETKISGEGLESLPVMKQLEKLDLEICRNLTNTGLLQLLGKCSTTLKDLILANTEISGEGLQRLPVLKLEKLDLGDCKDLTNTGLLQLLAKCSATLKDLNLYETYISGEGLESLPVLKQLKKVNLGSCRNLTNTGLLQLLAKCSATLEDLSLWGTAITGEILADWIARNRKLRWLYLENCWNVSAVDRERIRTALPQCNVN